MSLDSHPLVKKLEEKLLPEFEQVAAKIRQSFSNINVEISGNSIGSATQFQGYIFWLDCFIKDALDKENDNVWLEVGLGHLTTIPKIMAEADEVSFRNWQGKFPTEGIIITDEVLEDLYKDLPRLYEALFEALKRRKPADE